MNMIPVTMLKAIAAPRITIPITLPMDIVMVMLLFGVGEAVTPEAVGVVAGMAKEIADR